MHLGIIACPDLQINLIINNKVNSVAFALTCVVSFFSSFFSLSPIQAVLVGPSPFRSPLRATPKPWVPQQSLSAPFPGIPGGRSSGSKRAESCLPLTPSTTECCGEWGRWGGEEEEEMAMDNCRLGQRVPRHSQSGCFLPGLRSWTESARGCMSVGSGVPLARPRRGSA